MTTLREDLELLEAIQARHANYADRVLEAIRDENLEGGSFVPTDGRMISSRVELENGVISLSFENRFRGEADWYTVKFPEELWGDPKKIKEYLLKERADAHRQQLELEQRELQRMEREREEEDRRVYERLRRRFEH
jgi:hypothetical protein